jgi:hypothetical protein
MTIYRCYFHEKDGATTKWQPIYSNSEADARLAALDVLRAHVHVEKLEVWQGSNRLFDIGRELLKSNGPVTPSR